MLIVIYSTRKDHIVVETSEDDQTDVTMATPDATTSENASDGTTANSSMTENSKSKTGESINQHSRAFFGEKCEVGMESCHEYC